MLDSSVGLATRIEKIAGGITTLTTAVVILHIPIVYVTFVKKNCRSSFFKICAARSCGHLIASLTVGVSCSVALFINKKFLTYLINGYYFTLNFLFFSELLISLNRFVAVFYWTLSPILFTENKSLLYIGIIVLVSIGRGFLSVHDDCFATFFPRNMSMYFNQDSCNGEVFLLGFMEFLMSVGFGLNLVTLYKLIQLHKRRIVQDQTAKNRLRQNMTHFTFTFAQSIIWMIVGVSIIIRSDILTNYPYAHYVIEDLVEFMGSIAEGVLFWWLHGNHIINSKSFSNGNSNAVPSKVTTVTSRRAHAQ